MVADEEIDPPIKAGIDSTPSLIQQAESQGWEAKVFNFGTAEDSNVDVFNPGLVRRPDGLWLMARRATFENGNDVFGMNRIWACKLNDDLTPHGGKLLTWPDTIEHNQQFEDARCFYHAPTNKTWVSACNFIWNGDGSWTGAHQTIGEFACEPGNDETDWIGLRRIDPNIEGNGTDVHTRTKHQKNWVWFNFEGKLHLLYSTHPWSIIEFRDEWTDNVSHFQKEGVQWSHGLLRGGTPPLQVGDLFWTFYHSSMPWTGRFRRYFMGALAFEAKPPFKPVLFTDQPLLIGSQNDYWRDRKPLVVFPCGSVFENGKFLVTFGINDLKSGYVKIGMEDLLSRCKPIQKKFNPVVLDVSGASKAEELKKKRQEQAAKMRAAKQMKRGDEKCAAPVMTLGQPLNPNVQSIQAASNGAVNVQPTSAPLSRSAELISSRSTKPKAGKEKKTLSPEILEKLRSNLARARAIKAEKESQKNKDRLSTSLAATDVAQLPPKPRKKKRRIKRRSRLLVPR